MNSRSRCVLPTALLFLCLTAHAFVPDELVRKGRVLFAGGHYPAAQAAFEQALGLEPNNQEAHFWYAFARLASIPYTPHGSAFLTRLGVPEEGRIGRHWTAKLPQDANGETVLPPDFTAAEASEYLRTSALADLQAANQHLAAITDPGFHMFLSSDEIESDALFRQAFSLDQWAAFGDVWVDYGDVLLLRAILHFLEGFIYTTHAWNLDAQWATLQELEFQDMLSAGTVLDLYPNLFTFHTTADLAAARVAFQAGVSLYTEGYDLIRLRPSGSAYGLGEESDSYYLFNVGPFSYSKERCFRETLADLADSFNGPVVLQCETNLTVQLSRLFQGVVPPRDLFPFIVGSQVVAGTFPDPTFGGVILGVSLSQLDTGLAEGTDVVSKLYELMLTDQSAMQTRLNVLAHHAYAVEYSTDLVDWIEVAEFVSTNSFYWLSLDSLPSPDHGFLRLRDLTEQYVSIRGRVVDSCSGAPIEGAVLQYSGYGDFAVSGPDGAYFIQTRIPRNSWEDDYYYYYYYNETWIYVTAEDYVDRELYVYGEHEEKEIQLQPANAGPPPNDLFENRQALSGCVVRVAGATCGASVESGEPTLSNQSVWYEWVAPVEGYYVLRAESDWGEWPWLLVFGFEGGTDLEHLVSIPFDPYGEEFFAEAGQTILISVSENFDGSSSSFELELHAKPQITILSPLEAALIEGDQVAIDLDLVDPCGVVSSVVVSDDPPFSGEKEIATLDPAGPLSVLWERVTPGNYFIEVSLYNQEREEVGQTRVEIVVIHPNNTAENATVLPGVFDPVAGAAGNSLYADAWYVWTAPASGFVTFVLDWKRTLSEYYYYDPYYDPYYYYYGGTPAFLLHDGANLNGDSILAEADAFGSISWEVTAGAVYYLQVVADLHPVKFFISQVLSAPPTVTVLAPESPTTIPEGTPLTIAVDAQDADGPVCQVDYWVTYDDPYYYEPNSPLDGEWIAGSTNAPFGVVVTDLPGGRYLLWAVATDTHSLKGTSEIPVEIVVTEPPRILEHPQDLHLVEGADGWFSVYAAGTEPLEYQWRKDDVDLPGETLPYLQIVSATPDDEGAYDVVVTNPYGAAASNPAQLTVDLPPVAPTLGEAVDAPQFSWSTGGSQPWVPITFPSHDSIDSAQSGLIFAAQESWMQTTVTGPGNLSFWWSVSSEQVFDNLLFLIDNVPTASISGEVAWVNVSFPIPSGTHTVRWRYLKDTSVEMGQDRGWVDEVTFTP